jgi:hypothetical protein
MKKMGAFCTARRGTEPGFTLQSFLPRSAAKKDFRFYQPLRVWH